MSVILAKYGVAFKYRKPLRKAGTANHAASGDYTYAAGDVKLSKDGGAAANITNSPTSIAMGNSTDWEFSLTATELQCAQLSVRIADAATKAVDDDGFTIHTYGNASAQHPIDLTDSSFGMNVPTYAEPGQATPSATTTLATKIGYLYKALINKHDSTGALLRIYNNAGSVVDQKATTVSSGGTVTIGNLSTGP